MENYKQIVSRRSAAATEDIARLFLYAALGVDAVKIAGHMPPPLATTEFARALENRTKTIANADIWKEALTHARSTTGITEQAASENSAALAEWMLLKQHTSAPISSSAWGLLFVMGLHPQGCELWRKIVGRTSDKGLQNLQQFSQKYPPRPLSPEEVALLSPLV